MPPHSKSLIFIIPSLEQGGMERVMSELLKYFTNNHYDQIHLILYGNNRGIFYAIPDKVIIHKPDFEFNNQYRFWHTLKTLWFIRTKINSIKPYTILSFGEVWNNLVLLALYGLKFPVFVSDRCQPNKSLGTVHDWLRKWLYPKAAGIICQTEMAQYIYQRQFNHSNFKVIGNPIRTIENSKDVPKENIILSVGRLIATKHFDELINIFAQINPVDWKLVIVGDDALKQQHKCKLEQLVQTLGLSEKVILTGKREDVDDFYNRAKIFAFTSSSEGFPNVIGEAMSAGIPVIAYDCIAGPADLIEDGKTGFLIPLHDTKTFKEKLQILINDELLCKAMGDSGKASIKKYHADKIAKEFETFITHAHSAN